MSETEVKKDLGEVANVANKDAMYLLNLITLKMTEKIWARQ